MGDKHIGGDRDPLDEIYCGPMDNIAVAFQMADGTVRTETALAGAVAFNSGVPVLSENRTLGQALAMMGDCGALLDTLGHK